MLKILKCAILIGLTASLYGCKDDNSYEYLVTHPAVMKKKMDACARESKMATNAEKQRCEIVINASTKFMAIVAEQQTDAEAFGVRVLNAETAYANAKVEVARLKSDLAKEQAHPTDMTALHKLEEDLNVAEKACHDKRQEVSQLLAVVGVGTPD